MVFYVCVICININHSLLLKLDKEAFLSFLIGLFGYALYFIYDLNQVFNFSKLAKSAFGIGSLFVVVGTLWECSLKIENYLGLLIAIIGIIAEIYVLFFALDFNDTYVDGQFKVCDKGVYALCRHPGFYSFLLIYIGLYIAYQSQIFLDIMLLYNGLNILYIIFQDVFVFPRLFKDYPAYKKTTPFLLFTKKSITRCIDDFRGKQ